MRIFECVDLFGHLQRTLRMSLWDAMLCGWVARRSLQRADCSLAGDSAFKLSLNFCVERCSSGRRSHPQPRHAIANRIDMRFITYFNEDRRALQLPIAEQHEVIG